MSAGRGHARRSLSWSSLSLALTCGAWLSACGGSRAAEATGQVDASAAQAAREAPSAPSAGLIPQDAPRTGPVRTQDLAPLPEDEAAGKRSEAEWREHLDYEERERQMWFDQPRLAQHRALAKSIAQARAAYDAARSDRAVAAVQRQMPRKLRDLRERVARLDPWGVNSRLLGDYAQLFELLERDYPAARLGALGGDEAALNAARQRFDAHAQHMAEWLEEIEHEGAEGEAEREREGERERGAERER